MIVTAALYARVSTPNQEEEDTIDSQVAAIERYIKDHGYDLPSEFYFLDKAVSGARLDRPALDRLRQSSDAKQLYQRLIAEDDRHV